MADRAAQRRKELEEKRKKLEEYRLKNQAASATAAAPSPTTPVASTDLSASSFDELISAIDKLPAGQRSGTDASGAAQPAPVAAGESAPAGETKSAEAKPSLPQFTLTIQNSIFEVDVPPKEIIHYSKGTQTAPVVTSHAQEEKKTEQSTASTSTASTSTLTEQEQKKAEEQIAAAAATVVAEISPNERKEILESDDFRGFLSKASRVVERALSLSESFDILVDYSRADAAGDSGLDRSDEVVLSQTLFDERWSKHRVVTSLSWSPKHPELLLTSYSANEVGSNDPDGVVLVWSTSSMLKRPEFVFHCQSQVTTAFFPHFHSTTIVGGTYSGQVMLWDTRAKSTPMQKSAISTLGHTHPIYCATVIGTQNANNLVTISTDGKMCVWSIENLVQPIEVLDLYSKGKQASGTKNKSFVAATASAFPPGEANSFLIGSEEGAVFSANRHGNKTGIQERYEKHFGPITGLDCHPASTTSGAIDFSDLFLTSSTDWTTTLWSRKSTKPLYSFEDSADYIFDVKWSPSHPALFADVDGRGTLKLWNLNDDTEVPIAKVDVSPNEALNKLAWAADGRSIAVGNSSGSVFLYNIGEKIATPSIDSWSRLEESLTRLQLQSQPVHQTEEVDASAGAVPSSPATAASPVPSV